MNILPILNTAYPPAWGLGASRHIHIGCGVLRYGLHMPEPDPLLPPSSDIDALLLVSASLRTDGSLTISTATEHHVATSQTLYYDDPRVDIIDIIYKQTPDTIHPHIKTRENLPYIRKWAGEVLQEACAIMEQFS